MIKIKLFFCLVRKKRNRKTREWIIQNESPYGYKEGLGIISWFGSWRQYVFVPDRNTVWSSGCLDQISKFLKGCNAKHRKGLKNG